MSFRGESSNGFVSLISNGYGNSPNYIRANFSANIASGENPVDFANLLATIGYSIFSSDLSSRNLGERAGILYVDPADDNAFKFSAPESGFYAISMRGINFYLDGLTDPNVVPAGLSISVAVLCRYIVTHQAGETVGDAIAGTSFPTTMVYRVAETHSRLNTGTVYPVFLPLNHSIVLPLTAGATVKFTAFIFSQANLGTVNCALGSDDSGHWTFARFEKDLVALTA